MEENLAAFLTKLTYNLQTKVRWPNEDNITNWRWPCWWKMTWLMQENLDDGKQAYQADLRKEGYQIDGQA